MAPITVNQEILHAVGLVTSLNKPLKILGQGEVTVPLFVVADAFSKSAVAKIEAAGGTAQPLEIPAGPLEAIGVEVVEAEVVDEPARAPKKARAPKADAAPAKADAAPAKDEAPTVADAPAETEAAEAAPAAADEAASASGSDA
jgi:hypothetical protein